MKLVWTSLFLLISLYVSSQIHVLRFDIYNFEVGDEFHYRLTSSDCKGNYNQGSVDNTYRITNKEYSIDSSSVTYERDRSLRKNNVTENSHEWVTYNNLDSNLNDVDSTYFSLDYNGKNLYRIEEIGLDHTISEYAKGLGEVYNSFYDGFGDYCETEGLVYFKKGSEEWGNRLTMGIGESKGRNSLSIYPNPTQSDFTVFLDITSESADLRISDISGRVVYNKQNIEVPSTGQIKTSNLNLIPGIYFVEVIQEQIKYSSKLIVN